MPLAQFTIHPIATDGTDRSWTVTLNDHLSDLPLRSAQSLIERLLKGETIYVQDLYSALPRDLIEIANKSQMRIPDLYTAAQDLISQLGSPAALRQWHALLALEKQRNRWLKEAERDLAQLRNGRFIPYPEYPVDAYLFDGGETYSDDESIIDSLYDGDALTAAVGPYPYDRTPEVLKAHSQAARQWIRANARPYLFGATEHAWAGVSLSVFRDILEDEPEATAVEFTQLVFEWIDNDLGDNHHEDAHEEVKDGSHLEAIARGWFELRQLPGINADVLCEPGLTIWNRKQRITSIFGKDDEIVGAFPDVTRDEVIRWGERKIERLKADLDAVADLWRDPIEDPDAVIAYWRSQNILIRDKGRYYGDNHWHWDEIGTNTDTFTYSYGHGNYPTLELCVEAIRLHKESSDDQSLATI